eukprot:TRINITY_DN35500_c0_g1_i1.p1 TRINITY_DN35500_c0_g1~~TRINITY_DN35500_c0_g1_i1.p1  ORF type:complete len:524 (-),score=63.42 TRINITY_DN35500_c0_g1_i1:114-1685(-)
MAGGSRAPVGPPSARQPTTSSSQERPQVPPGSSGPPRLSSRSGSGYARAPTPRGVSNERSKTPRATSLLLGLQPRSIQSRERSSSRDDHGQRRRNSGDATPREASVGRNVTEAPTATGADDRYSWISKPISRTASLIDGQFCQTTPEPPEEQSRPSRPPSASKPAWKPSSMGNAARWSAALTPRGEPPSIAAQPETSRGSAISRSSSRLSSEEPTKKRRESYARSRSNSFASESGRSRPPSAQSRSSSVQGEGERCAGCSKDTFDELFDAFEAMDLRDNNSIRRKDFHWALGSGGLGTRLDFQRAVRRTNLTKHFYSTAEDLSLEAYLRLAFPCASPPEMGRFRQWADMRKAYLLLTPKHGFTAQKEELKRIYYLLRDDQNACISPRPGLRPKSLVEAKILPQEELSKLFYSEGRDEDQLMSYPEFAKFFKPVLDQKYGQGEEKSPEWRQFARRRLAAIKEDEEERLQQQQIEDMEEERHLSKRKAFMPNLLGSLRALPPLPPALQSARRRVTGGYGSAKGGC